MVWEPNSSFNMSVDCYQITWTEHRRLRSFQDVVDANDPNRVIRDPTTGNIVTVLSNYRNLSRTETQGVDIDARYIASTNYGRFTTRLNATYVDEFEEEGIECAGAQRRLPTPTRAGRASCRSIGTRVRGQSRAA